MAKFGEWTRVEDEVPMYGDYSVFVALTNGSVEDMKMWHVQDWAHGLIDQTLKVTHWMPMPPHPEVV